MHTEVLLSRYGQDVRIHHNGDWSGNAALVYTDGSKRSEHTIPGWVAQMMCRPSLDEVRDGLKAILNRIGS